MPEFNYLFDDKVENQDYECSSIAPTLEQLPKPSVGCNYDTQALYLAAERILEENPKHDLAPKAIWNTLIAKKGDGNYKINLVEPHEEKPRSFRIIFDTGYSPDYHAAQAHIKKVIQWFKSKSIKSNNPH